MSKFANYEVLSTDYKVVAGTGIAVDVILPNEIAAGKQAVIVRFHGGGWVCPPSPAAHGPLLNSLLPGGDN